MHWRLYDGPFISPVARTVTTKEVLKQLRPDSQLGTMVLQDFHRFIADKRPVDRWGYPALMPGQEGSWRRAQVSRMSYALRELEACYNLID